MADYDFYAYDYLGVSIPQEDWPAMQARAEDYLSLYRRIYTVEVPDNRAEDMAVCAMADVLYYYALAQNGQGGAVASASIGSVSVSYAAGSGADISEAAQEKSVYRAACRYLDICRGVGGC